MQKLQGSGKNCHDYGPSIAVRFGLGFRVQVALWYRVPQIEHNDIGN